MNQLLARVSLGFGAGVLAVASIGYAPAEIPKPNLLAVQSAFGGGGLIRKAPNPALVYAKPSVEYKPSKPVEKELEVRKIPHRAVLVKLSGNVAKVSGSATRIPRSSYLNVKRRREEEFLFG